MTHTRKLRIGIDARPALWGRMGIGTLCLNVIKRIQDADPHNEYIFYFDSDPAELASQFGLLHCRFVPISNKLLWANIFIPRWLKRDGVDIYISFLEKEIPFVMPYLKIMTLVCDLIPLKQPSFRNVFHRWYYLTLLRLATKTSDVVLTISENSKKDLQSAFGISSNKLRVIRLGASSAPCDHDRAKDVLQRYGIPSEYILAIGSTEPRKNNAKLIRAFNRLKQNLPSLHLVVVGSEWRGLQFDQNLLNNRILQVGYVKDEDLACLYTHAQALVYPSLYEGFGLPVLEAMASGSPVIASRAASLPEVAGDAALYVNPHDEVDIARQIEWLLGNPDLRKDLVARGLRRAALFTWEQTCKDIVSSYARLCPTLA